MARRPILRSLMAGVAVASLSTAAMAEGWSSFIVFGDRNHDSGQQVSHEALFAEDGDEFGDGRTRATNIVSGGGRGKVISQIVADRLGFGQPLPSQPATVEGVPTPPDGFNYAAAFYGAENVLDSIDNIAITTETTFRNDRGEETTIPRRFRDGLLVDDERRDHLNEALVLMNGGTTDLRSLANVDRELDGSISLEDTSFTTDEMERDETARDAAWYISYGARRLSEEGAGLVVVTNSYDVGAIPEVDGDIDLLDDVNRALENRESDAERTELFAQRSETIRDAFNDTYRTAIMVRNTLTTDLAAAQADPTSDPATIASLQTRLAAATTSAEEADTAARAQTVVALQARTDAGAAALTDHELDLRTKLDIVIADPSLVGSIRTAGTDVFNESLTENLRDVEGNIVVVDQRALFDEIIANPGRFGLETTVDQSATCLFRNVLYPCTQVNGSVEDHLFTNGIELTTKGHLLAAEQIAALVQAPAALAAAPSVGLSSGRSVADASRDQLSREQSWKAGVSVFATGGASRIKLTDENGFPQSDGGFYSGVVGAKYVFGNGIAVGAAGSYQTMKTPGSESTVHYSGDAMIGTVFAGVNTGPIFGNATATYGKLDYDSLARISKIGAARILNSGETTGTVKGVTAEAGIRLVQYDVLRAGPIANFSHWTSTIDGYAESGWQTTAIHTDDLEVKSTRAGLGMFLEAGGIVDGYGTLFRAKALYGHEFQDDTKSASVRQANDTTGRSFTTTVRGADAAPFELGGEVVLGYGGIITTFGYDGLFGDVSDHRFRLGASLPLGG